MEFASLADVVGRHLSMVLEPSDFDIVPAADGHALDISTDHWTLHLEAAGGFLAIDEEPVDPATFAAARRAVMSERVERALAAADRELGAAISSALAVTADPFSLDFVDALTRSAGP